MRIILLINSYIEGLAGGDIWAIENAKRLSLKNDIKVVIVTPQRAAKLWKEKGLNQCEFIITTKEKKPNLLPLLYFKRILNYFKITFDSDKDDVLFATSIFFPDIFPLLLLKGKKVAIFHMQAPHPLYGYMIGKTKKIDIKFGNVLNWLNEKISMSLLKMMNANIFVLTTTKDIVKRYGFSDEQIFTTTNGIDIDFINSIPEQKKEFDACWVGRPHPQKGLDDLLDIWEKLIKKNNNLKLILVGPIIHKYKKIILEKNLEKNVILAGFVSDEEKFIIIKKSKMFISTSYFESFHIAILEAAACNLPIFAYDLPVYKTIYGDNLLYSPIGNKEDMCENIFSYINGDKLIIEKLNKMQRMVSNHSWEKISDELIKDIYKIKN